MNNKIYKDMDTNTYESIAKILNYDKKRLLVLSKKRRNIFIEELDKIKDVNNIRIIKYLLVICFDKDLTVASKALNHLKRIIYNLKVEELMFFAEHFRSSYYSYSIDCDVEKSYRETSKYNLDSIYRFGKDAIYILSVLTLHSNGYIREDALKKLAEFEDGFKIKFIMIRVNDWVKNIRIFAKKQLIKCMEKEYTKHIIKCLPIIDRINTWGRDDYSDILLKLEKFIIDEKNYDLLMNIYKDSEEIAFKRRLFKCLVKINTTASLIINVGLKSKDIIILRAAIKEIDKVINKKNEELIFKSLKNNKNAICKVAAIDILEKMNIQNFNNVYISFLYDKSFTVREYIRYKLKRNGITNFREMYLEEINNSSYNLYGVISGVKETGEPEDINYIIKYLNHESVKIRKIALSTICKLNMNEGLQYAIDKLCSDNISESNNARKCLGNRSLLLNENMIFEMFEIEGYDSHVYINLIKLAKHHNKWTAIIQLLKILKISSNDYIQIINEEIEKWIDRFNKSFNYPKEEQIDNISKLCNVLGKKLSSNNSFQIGNILRNFDTIKTY